MALGKVTNYVKNLAKSVVYSSEDVLGKIAPTTIAYKEQNADLIKSTYNIIKDPRNAMARTVEYVKSTKIYEAGTTAYTNTLEDLATGKFYNKERETSIGGSAFGMDTDMGFDFDSLDKALDDMDNISDGDKETIKSIEKTAKASTTATTAAIVETAKYQAEVSKTNTGILFSQNERLFGRLQTGIDSISSGINNITKFNISSFQSHIENSTKFYDVITKNNQEQTAILKEILEMQRNVYKEKQEAAKQNKIKERKKKLSFGDITNSSGAVNIADYFKIVTENIKNVGSDYGLGLLNSFGEDSNPLLAFASNPLSILPISLVNAAIGPKFKTYAKQLDKSFSGMFGTLIARLNNMAKKDDDPISQFIGKIFGIKNNIKTSIDTSRYAKGAISFDGITKEAIVNVIPTYLAKIESAITGMSERIYDYEYGKWTTGEELAKKMRNEQKSTVRSAFNDVISAFGDIKNRNKIKFETLAQETQFSKDMDNFFLSIYTKGGYFNPNKPGSHINWGISTKQNFDALVAMYKTLPKHVQMSIGREVIDARSRYTHQMEQYEDNPNSPYRHLFSNRGIDSHLNINRSQENSVITGRKLLIDRDDFGNSQFFYLQEMLKNLIVISKYSAENYNINAQSISKVYGKRNRSNTITTANRVKISKNSAIIPKSFDISSIELPKENAKTEANNAKVLAKQREESYEKNVYKDSKVVLDQYDDKAVKMWEQLGILNTEKMLENEITAESNDMGFIARDIRKALSLKPSDNKSKDSSKEDEAKKKRDELVKALDSDKESNSWANKFKSLGIIEKWHYITDKVYKFTEIPSRAISKMLINANNAIYDFFFEKENDLPMGKRVKGWFNLMTNRTVDFFDELFKKAKLDLFDPVRKFLGLKEIKDGLKDEFKNSDFYKDYVEATVNKFKEKLGLLKKPSKPKAADPLIGYRLDNEYSQNVALNAAFGITPGFEAKDDAYWKKLRAMSEINREKNAKTSKNPAANISTDIAKTTELGEAATQMAMINAAFGKIPGYAHGARYINESGITAISKGEMIIPSELNPFNPDRYRVNKSREKAIENQKAKSFSEKFTESVFGKIGRNAEGTVPKPKNDVVQSISNTTKAGKNFITNYLSGYADVFYASGTDKKSLAYNDVFKNPKKYVPEALAGGGIGAVLGLLTGLGPMAGLVIGAGASVANASDAVKSWLFGETIIDDEGNADGRAGGLVSRKTQEKLTEMIPDLKFYGTLGGAAGLFGFAPFGILGGLTLGAAAAYVKNNTKFMEFMFGDKDGIINADRKKWLKDKFPSMAIGTAGTYLFGPFGLVGSAILGSTAGIISTTDAFKDTLFGKEMYNGKRHGGILGALGDNFVDPLVKFSNYMANDMINFVKNDIMEPFARGIAPLTKYTLYTIRDTVASLASTIGTVGGSILSGLPSFGRYTGFLGSPFSKLAGKVIGGAFLGTKGVVKGLASLPFKTIGKLGDRAQRKMILSGDEYGMDAAQRYNYARDNGMNLESAALKADQVLIKSNYEELDAIEKNLQMLVSNKAGFSKSVEADKDVLERNIRLKVKNPYTADTIIEHLYSTEPGRLDEAIQMLAKSGDYPSSKDRLNFLTYVMQAAISLQRNKALMKNFNTASKNATERLKKLGLDIKNTKDAKKLLKRIDTEKSTKLKIQNDQELKSDFDKVVDADNKNTDRIVDVLADIKTILNGGTVLNDTQKVHLELSNKIADFYTKNLRDIENLEQATAWDLLSPQYKKKGLKKQHLDAIKKKGNKHAQIARFLKDADITFDNIDILFKIENIEEAEKIAEFVNKTGKVPKNVEKLKNFKGKQLATLIKYVKENDIDDLSKVSTSVLQSYTTKNRFGKLFGIKNSNLSDSMQRALSSMKSDENAIKNDTAVLSLSDSNTGDNGSFVRNNLKNFGKRVYKLTNDGVIGVEQGSDGKVKYSSDGETKETLQKQNLRYKAYMALASIGNFLTNKFSSNNKNQSESKSKEKDESFLSKLLSGASILGNKLGSTSSILGKLGLGLLGGSSKIAAVGTLSYLIAPHVDDIVGTVANGVSSLITFLFDSAKLLIEKTPQIAEGVYTGVKNAVFGAKLSAEELTQKGWHEATVMIDGVEKLVYQDDKGKIVGEVAQGLWDRSKVGTILGGAATLGYAGYKMYKGYKAGSRALRDLRRVWTGKNDYKISELPPDTQAIVSETKETNNILNAIYEKLFGNRLSTALDSAGNTVGGMKRGKVYGTLKTPDGVIMRPKGPASKPPRSDSNTGKIDNIVNIAKENLPKLKETISSRLPNSLKPIFNKMSSVVIKKLPGFIGKYGLSTTVAAFTGGLGFLGYSAVNGITGFIYGLKDAESIYGREVSYSERIAAACAGAISGALYDLITPEDIIGFFNEDGGVNAVEKEVSNNTATTTKNSQIITNNNSKPSTPKANNSQDFLNAPISESASRFFSWLGGTANRAKAADSGKGKYGRGYYKQFDPRYANMQFNDMGDSIYQNMADSGCGPVAAVNALGGANPIDAAQFALKGGFKERNGGTKPEFFKSYFNAYGKDAHYTHGAGIINNLKAGNPVVLMGQSNRIDSNTPYGTGPHYVTATGLDRRGNIIVQDPQDSRSNITYRASDVLSKTKFGVAARVKFRYGRGTGNTSDTGSLIWTTLQNAGLTNIAIAAIMGNMMKESRLNPKIVQNFTDSRTITAENITVDGKTGYGLCQWTNSSRQQNLANFAKSKGLPSGDLMVQLDFMLNEMGSTLINNLNSEKDIAKATILFHDEYEKSDDGPNGIGERIQYAKKALDTKGVGLASYTYSGSTDYKFGNYTSSNTSNITNGIIGYFTKRASNVTNLYNKIFGGAIDSNYNSNTNFTSRDMGKLSSPTNAGSAKDYLNKNMAGSTISSEYGMRTLDGITRMHGGVDFGIDQGTYIPSPVSGTVVDVGSQSNGFGNYVQIKDKNNNLHLFAHLSEIGVSKGESIDKHKFIAASGGEPGTPGAGSSTGAHLHYQIDPPSNAAGLSSGEHIDPNSYDVSGLGKFRYNEYRKRTTRFGKGPIMTPMESPMPSKSISSDYTQILKDIYTVLLTIAENTAILRTKNSAGMDNTKEQNALRLSEQIQSIKDKMNMLKTANGFGQQFLGKNSSIADIQETLLRLATQ